MHRTSTSWVCVAVATPPVRIAQATAHGDLGRRRVTTDAYAGELVSREVLAARAALTEGLSGPSPIAWT